MAEDYINEGYSSLLIFDPTSDEAALDSLLVDVSASSSSASTIGSTSSNMLSNVATDSVDSELVEAGEITEPLIFANETYIRMGDATAPLTGIGIWMGYDLATPGVFDFRIGDPAGNYLHYDASAGTLTVTGSLNVAELHVPDTTTANSMHVNTAGDTWWGANSADFASDNNNALAYVLKTGVAKFQSVTITSSSSSIEGTALINNSTASNVQSRAEALFTEDMMYVGRPDDSDTALTEFMTATAGGGGTITRRLLMTTMEAGAATNTRLVGSGVMATTIDDSTVEWSEKDLQFYINAEFESITNQDAYLGFWARTTTPAVDATAVDRHIGFYLQDGTMYVSNADGTTQTKTSIAGSVTITDMNLYWFLWDAGTAIYFYINDVLVATHTTNLPTTQDGIPYIQIAGDGTATRKMDIKNNYTFIMTEPA